MRKVILALAFLIASPTSFADDLPLSLEPLTRKNLPDYKNLLRYFAQEDQGAASEFSMAHLTAHEEEIDTLAALGLYEISTLFTDWLIIKGDYIIGRYSLRIPVDEFLLDSKDLIGAPLPVPVLERFVYPPKFPPGGAEPFESGCSIASMRLLKGVKSSGIKEAIEASFTRDRLGNHQYVPFFRGGRFCQTVTKHPFRGVRYG